MVVAGGLGMKRCTQQIHGIMPMPGEGQEEEKEENNVKHLS